MCGVLKVHLAALVRLVESSAMWFATMWLRNNASRQSRMDELQPIRKFVNYGPTQCVCRKWTWIIPCAKQQLCSTIFSDLDTLQCAVQHGFPPSHTCPRTERASVDGAFLETNEAYAQGGVADTDLKHDTDLTPLAVAATWQHKPKTKKHTAARSDLMQQFLGALRCSIVWRLT